MNATGNCKIIVKFPNDNQNYSFTYEFNAKTTFENMIAFMAELYPHENICPCVTLTINNKKVPKNENVCKLCYKSVNIEITKENCECAQQFKEYFSKSKTDILNLLFDKINKLENEKIKLLNIIDREPNNNNINNNNNNNNNNDNNNNDKNNNDKNNNNNKIQIDENSNQIVINNNDNNEIDYLNSNKYFENFYDVIIDINSIKDINKGWEIKMNEKGEKHYNEFKTQQVIKIGIIGNSNKGKSFLLSKISKINLPSGTSIRTSGLSIKYPDDLNLFKERKIVLLDSAGLETPVLKDDEYLNNKNNINEKELFKEKSREKLITELFLQNYIINNSDILLIVVGILTYSEQKLLNRIKTEIQRAKINKPLYIIHNLITFTSIKQVEEYINKYLLKSATFDLELGHKITTKIQNKTGTYYNEKNSNPKVYHLIFANEGSEAGEFYNNFVLDFLENSFQTVTDLQNFDIIQSVKERFIEVSKDIFEKTEEQKLFTIDDFENSENNNKIIKLSKEQNIILKKCLIDELGFSNLKTNGFEPTYNYYKKGNDKIIIRVEGPGNCSVRTTLDYSGEYTIIRLNGEKKKDKEPEKIEDNFYCTREFGEFSLDIPLKTEDFFIKNEPPKIIEKKGILMLEFILDQKKVNGTGYEINEEEEV